MNQAPGKVPHLYVRRAESAQWRHAALCYCHDDGTGMNFEIPTASAGSGKKWIWSLKDLEI